MTEEERPKPQNVVEALAAVIAEMPSVGKGKTMQSGAGGSYKYRSIEDITGTVGPLFGKYGIVLVPKVESVTIKEVTLNSRPWTRTEMMVSYAICGPTGAGLDVSRITAGPFLAIALDNSDKGANKAMTQAYKQLLLQLLCISDDRDDPDNASPQEEPPKGAGLESAFRRQEAAAKADKSPSSRSRKPPTLPSQARKDKPMEQVIEEAFPGTEEAKADPWDAEEAAMIPANEPAAAMMRAEAAALAARRPDLGALLSSRLVDNGIDLRKPIIRQQLDMVSKWLEEAATVERNEEPF